MRLSRLYEVDEVAWLEESTRLIKEGKFGELDFKNLKDFLESAARWDKREVKRRLRTLLNQMLDWHIKAKRRTGPWKGEIFTQKYELADLLSSKTLKDFAVKTLEHAYQSAVRLAAIDADWDAVDFPLICPYRLEDILDEDFYPEGPLETTGALAHNGRRRQKSL
jgi:hypothetical protein